MTKRRYAVKKITCHSIEDQKIALREVELTRAIKHPNVIHIVDFELQGDADIVINTISHLYIVFPYYKNGTLHDHLNMRAKLNDSMPELQVLQIFIGICEGLKALHEATPEPLAHRDLKTGRLRISFFGCKYHSLAVTRNNRLLKIKISRFHSEYLPVRLNGGRADGFRLVHRGS